MKNAFRLEVGPDRLATLTFDLPDSKHNVFKQEVLEELDRLIGELAQRQDIGCLVLLSAKPGSFIAGADVDAIAGVEDPVLAAEGSRIGHRLFSAWEALPFPTVAAIQGTCLGGGTELSLASTYRVVSDREDVKIGLPEIKLGILPAWGGCTRLPRLIGIQAALDIILAGKNVRPKKALRLGLVDAMLPDASFLAEVRRFAHGKIDSRRGSKGMPSLKTLILEKTPLGRKILFDQARKMTLEKTGGQYPAPLRALEVVKVGIERGKSAGFEAEARAVGELATSPVCKNLIHIFHLSEKIKKDDMKPDGEARPISRAAVLGAGVMGGGIAQLLADKLDVPVMLKDINNGALASGMAHASSLWSKRVRRRWMRKPEADRKMALLRPTLDYDGFSKVDLVIEAVIEKLAIKQQVFADTAAATPDDAILASNTSSLSIEAIGEKTPDRGRVVGMHFFNPVDKMPLVEVIAGASTGPDAVRTIYDLCLKLGKTPVVVKDGPGFLVNRLLMFYSTEALWLLDEGHKIEDIDRAMDGWGMPMGPLALTDEVGIDVAVKVAHILHDAFSDRLPLPPWLDGFDGERLGKKSGSGFYAYEGRKRLGPDPEVYRLLGLAPSVDDPPVGPMIDRMMLPMVNEAARCLGEGVIADPGSLDLSLVMGTGFPPFRGGLCRWADSQGLAGIVDTLERFASTIDRRFEPSDALRQTAAEGGFYGGR